MPKKIYVFLTIVFALALTACASNNINDAQQHYSLGQQYFHAQNYIEAFNEINKAAQRGNSDAQYALGYMYFNGIGTRVDNTAGLFWIKQAANKGQSQAIKALTMLNNQTT